jgi:hypothetical protein
LIGDQKEDFEELVRCLRFHHMSPTFLTAVVLRSKRWADCPFLAHACSNALLYQSLASSFSKVPHEGAANHLFASAKSTRVRDKIVTYNFEGEVRLADCLPLGLDEGMYLRLGVAEGRMVYLYVSKDAHPDAAPTLALNVEFTSPEVRDMDEEESVQSDTVGLSGPMAAVRIAAAGKRASFTHVYAIRLAYGYPNFFKKPWDEVVREGSDYFPEGSMTVTVDIHFITDKHMKPHVPVME